MPPSVNWQELVANWAEIRAWKYQTKDSQAIFDFSDGPGGRGLNMSIAASSDHLSFQMTDDRYLDEKDLPVAVAAANLWNGTHGLPTAYIQVPEDGSQAYIGASFIADMSVDCDLERFARLADTFVQLSLSMFEYFNDKYAL
ncbi:hypothetical protein [Streptomyces sp. PSKA30]|uniref:hypothetical protein n=1 Tax=Streptomyces sp. PSKA30 TaxID=2874597 RepID=UPI001CD0F66B|nr:hypothetical protein [Streptomyces sp. PSKA30]MBZ9644878.1 hypothetical protein [Streptomyces sp. PSKA30]